MLLSAQNLQVRRATTATLSDRDNVIDMPLKLWVGFAFGYKFLSYWAEVPRPTANLVGTTANSSAMDAPSGSQLRCSR